MTTRDDETLLKEYCSGSEDAFRELAQRYGALVYAACLRTLRSSELAEDAAQAVFLVLARKAGRLQVRTTLIPWLLTTSRVVCRHHARAERRRLRHEQSLNDDVEAAEIAVDNSIVEALEKLRDPEREAVVLRFIQGLSLGEVGRIQGITEDAARMRIKRGISRLRKSFSSNLVINPALLIRLASPKMAPATIQQLALKSTTMISTSSIAALTFVGLAGIGAAGYASFFRTHLPNRFDPKPPYVKHAISIQSIAGGGGPSRKSLYYIPELNGPFTLKYRLRSNNAPNGNLRLTISSEGSNLLVYEEDTAGGQPRVNTLLLNSDSRSYLLNPGTPGVVHSSMWVTSSIAVAPPIPFVGVDFPTLQTKFQWVGKGVQQGTEWMQPSNILEIGAPPEYPYAKGLCYIESLKPDVNVISSFVEGSDKVRYDTWKFSGYKQFGGKYLATKIAEQTANQSVNQSLTFELLSEQPNALAHELFSPEHYLLEGDLVQYKIPKQAGMELDFDYKPNGTSIEEQAKIHDQLEMKIHNIHPKP